MTTPTKHMTVEEFDKWVFLPDNVDHSFEYIAGEIVKVVSNNYSSKIAFEVGFHIRLHMQQHHIKGHITGADGGYIVKGERYIPDIGFISVERQPESSHDTYNPVHPDLAVEVVSPTDGERNLAIKIANYVAAGTVVWVVYPDDKEVNIFTPGEAVQRLSENDIIHGGTVLPDFTLQVSEIFPED